MDTTKSRDDDDALNGDGVNTSQASEQRTETAEAGGPMSEGPVVQALGETGHLLDMDTTNDGMNHGGVGSHNVSTSGSISAQQLESQKAAPSAMSDAFPLENGAGADGLHGSNDIDIPSKEPNEQISDEKGEPSYKKSKSQDSRDESADGLREGADGLRKAADDAQPSATINQDNMESSEATLRPGPTTPTLSPFPNGLKSDATTYLDPTPKTPFASTPSSGLRTTERSPTCSDAGFDEKPSASEDERDPTDKAEIQSIMDQFSVAGGGPGEEEVMSPRLEMAGPLLDSEIKHPPRKSSLVSLNKSYVQDLQNLKISEETGNGKDERQHSKVSDKGPEVPPKEISMPGLTPIRSKDSIHCSIPESPMSPHATSLYRPPLPEPEPEPDLPFDFHRFLEQLRHRTADPVAKFLRSFLAEFGKKQWMVHEQVKIIGDFLVFITQKMAQCEVWREVSDAEFDNAREGMEKLVMNRLYNQTFGPAIPPPQPIPGARPRRRGGERPMGPGRRGQHQEDVERDELLAQKISIYGWVKEEHLDIPPVGDSGRRFLVLAQQELLKIKTYRAPRDKIICVLNCCKVIFGLLKHSKSDGSADSFMPLLIYTVLRANPEHLVSNVQYILRFRNQDKLGGEAGYYLSSLLGSVQFIENLDRTSLTITDEEFEKNVEQACKDITERALAEEVATAPPPPPKPSSNKPGSPPSSHSEKPRKSTEEQGRSTTSRDGSDDDEDKNEGAAAGLLRTFRQPLNTIGRMFGDDSASPSVNQGTSRPRTPLTGMIAGSGSQRFGTPRRSTDVPLHRSPQGSPNRPPVRTHVSEAQASEHAAEAASTRQLLYQDAAEHDGVLRAVRQASAEAAEAQRLAREEHKNVVETLQGMFPDLDRDVISDVVAVKNGRVGQAVDACLALSS